MIERPILIPRVWRSQSAQLILFIVISPICIWLSNTFPLSIIAGPLLSFGDSTLELKLPLFWFVPLFIVGQAVLRIYDVRYIIDKKGIESKIGILSLSQTITRIRYEDIRSIDSRQTLSERMLGIGTLEMGTAASAGLEMSFSGIANPLKVQKMIQAERDARLRQAASRQHSKEYDNAVVSGAE